MQDGNVEISKTGLKFSYLRFLADGAAGLFMILLFALGYYADLPILGQEKSFRCFFVGRIDANDKIFLMILIGLLAVPLGLVLNASGWFLFGFLQRRGCEFWFAKKWTGSTRAIFHQELLVNKINLKEENLYRKAKLYDEFLTAISPAHLVHVQHILGLQRFLRSLSIVFLLAGSYVALSRSDPKWMPVGGYIVMMALSLLLLSLLEYYVCLAIVCRTYLLSLEYPESILSSSEDVSSVRPAENNGEERSFGDESLPDQADAEVLDRLIRRLPPSTKAEPG